MCYTIRHLTKYRYSAMIRESVMEVHMQPRSDSDQRCLSFELSISSRARALPYTDYLGNTLHNFSIPGQHTQMTITARALVDMKAFPTLPEALDPSDWEELDALIDSGDYWDALTPSRLTTPTPLLHELAQALNVQRRNDPLCLLREINTALYQTFDYEPKTTNVDSPIDDVLQNRAGVCQDFSHIMLTLVRELRIPCRYVSGYLFHQRGQDRSAEDATHAWIEAFLPSLGWIGFDPTNNVLAGSNHIRVAIGRDYADIPPTRGVFKGTADTELSVAVQVSAVDEATVNQELIAASQWTIPAANQDEPEIQQVQQQNKLDD